MKCSVIIPYYNRIALLRNTLLALAHQVDMEGEYEIVVVDDGSDERIDGFIAGLGIDVPVHYHYFERGPHSCLSFVRNRGIERSIGVLLVFIDCDIVVMPDFLKNQYAMYEAAKGTEIFQIGMRRSFLGGALLTIDEMIRVQSYTEDMRRNVFSRFSENLQIYEFVWMLAYGCNLSASREIMVKYGAFDEKLIKWSLEDNDIAYKLSRNGVKFVYNPCTEVYHQYHEFKETNFANWLNNLRYLEEKYQELDFRIIDLIRPLFNAESLVGIMEEQEKLGLFGQDALANAFCDLFAKAERCLRIMHGRNVAVVEDCRVIVNPRRETLCDLIPESESQDYMVICTRQSFDVIAEIQTNSRFRDVHLHTY